MDPDPFVRGTDPFRIRSKMLPQHCFLGSKMKAFKLFKIQKIYLSDNVDAEVESLEALHAEEGAGEDLLDQVPAEVQVLQGAKVLQVHVSNRL
jgi:hypothetical protein